jgi:glycosyltransferase involved in cell wall biosynthesis
MKTVMVLHSGGVQIRGSEICLIHSIDAIAEKGFGVVVLRKQKLLDEFVQGSARAIIDEQFPEIMFDGSHRSFPLIKYSQSLYRLYRLVKKYRPCVIYCNTGLPCQIAVPVGKLLNIPVLCQFHHPAPKRYFYLWLVKYATKLIFPSNFTRSVVMEKSGRDGDVIYNAVDIVERFVPVSPKDFRLREEIGFGGDAVVVGQVGNLTGHKRPDVLIRCFAEAYKKNSALRLVLVGHGPLFDDLQALVESLGVAHLVKFKGYVPDVLPYYQHVIDINVLASNNEGLGISVIEASACELPSIVTDCTGLREVVDDGVTGYTFDVDDSSQLTEFMLRLANDPALRKNMGLAAREKAEKLFSLEEYKSGIVRQVENLC